jgi:hypothetical protein
MTSLGLTQEIQDNGYGRMLTTRFPIRIVRTFGLGS